MSEESHRWPRAVLVGLAASAPFNVSVTTNAWTELQLRLLVIVALVAVVVLTIRSMRLPTWHRPDWIDTIAYCWLLAVWASVLTSEDKVLGTAGAARLSVVILLIPVTRSVITTARDAQRVLRALGSGVAVAAIFGLGVWGWGKDIDLTRAFVGSVTQLGPFDRLTRPWSHANVAAMALGASIASIATLRLRYAQAAALVVSVMALVLTISRGGLVAGCAAAITWVVLRRRRSDAMVVASLVVFAAIVFTLSSAWTTRVDQLGDQAFYGSQINAPGEFEVTIAPGLVDVEVTNESSRLWPQQGDDRVLISARWIGPDELIWTEDWWELPADLEPGESITASLSVESRVPVGDFAVRWDLVIPGTAYFGQFLGAAPTMSQAAVTSSLVGPGDNFRYDLVQRDVGLGRIDGWKLAWEDFRSHPLLGVGPNQFGDQAASRLASQQQSIGAHAHNVVFEPLAAWGLLGALPYLVLGVGALARALRQAWSVPGLGRCAVAVGLVAVTVHGAVDWPLVTVTTGIPVGLLVGLAWSDLDKQP